MNTDPIRVHLCSSVVSFQRFGALIFALASQIFNGFVTAGKFEPPRFRGPEYRALQEQLSIGQCPPFVPLSPRRSRPRGDFPSKPFPSRSLHGEWKGVRHWNGPRTKDNGLPASNA